MKIRFADISEIENWNSLITCNPDQGDVFQAKQFAEIKQTNHWTPRFLVGENIYFLALERKIPLLGNFWYIPKGPGVSSLDELRNLLPELKIFAKTQNVFAIKLEPELIETLEIIHQLDQLGLVKSRAVQAANTVVVDISKSLDEIVAGFTSKTRGNIRAAQKENVTTEIVLPTNENCKIFYDLMSKTINGRSHLRNYAYFKNFWQAYINSGNGVFMFAKSGNDILSMDFIMILGVKAARKDAASDREHSIRGASALLELEAIKYLKEIGVTDYDLYGCPPSSEIKNPDHPYYGFGTFKAGFNREQITDYVGCWDLVVKPVAYKIWRNNGERIVHKIHSQKHHDLYY